MRSWAIRVTFLLAGVSAQQAQAQGFLTLPLRQTNPVIEAGWRYNSGRPHYGINYRTSLREEVIAACDGRAIATTSSSDRGPGAYGTFVLQRCDNLAQDGSNYFVIYAHLDSSASRLAQRSRFDTTYVRWTPVMRGEVVGLAGSSGMRNGYVHLHLEVFTGRYSQKAGHQVDPYGIRSVARNYPGPCTNTLWLVCPPRPYAPSGIPNTWTSTTTVGIPTTRAMHTAVWTGEEMIVWGGYAPGDNYFNTGGRYTPALDSWMPTSLVSAPAPRRLHTAVWTGSEMIVWGGGGVGGLNDLNTGGRYNPASDSWTSTNVPAGLVGRSEPTSIWTGTLMIVWGGSWVAASDPFNGGGRYSPTLDAWTPLSRIGAPSIDQWGHSNVWTGEEMIVWGGIAEPEMGVVNTDRRYNPAVNSWTAISTTGAPSPRRFHQAVWTGEEMIVWGGEEGWALPLATGGVYYLGTNSWEATTLSSVPSARTYFSAVWSGEEMIVWGGLEPGAGNTGGRYDPITDSWGALATAGSPAGRYYHTAVWTGSEMIVWGGDLTDGGFTNTGGRYTPP